MLGVSGESCYHFVDNKRVKLTSHKRRLQHNLENVFRSQVLAFMCKKTFLIIFMIASHNSSSAQALIVLTVGEQGKRTRT